MSTVFLVQIFGVTARNSVWLPNDSLNFRANAPDLSQQPVLGIK